MGYNYIEINGSNEKLPPQQCFLFITRELKKPIKTKENKDSYISDKKNYDTSMKKREEMFKVFESGLVDMHDRSIEPTDITKNIGDIIIDGFDKNIVYLIEPLIVSKQQSSSYQTWQYKNKVHTFNIVKEVTSIEELFEHAYVNNYYEDFMANIFDKIKYTNKGYKENVIKWFEYAKEKYPCNNNNYPDYKLTLWDIIRNNQEVVKSESVQYMLDNNLIYLHDKYDEESTMFKRLIQYSLFELANKYLNLIEYDYAINVIKSDKDILAIVKSSSNDQFVKEILKTLEIEDKSVSIRITKYGDYDDFIEDFVFEDINKAKAHIVKNYVVDFDKVYNSIDKIYVSDEYDNEFYIEVI